MREPVQQPCEEWELRWLVGQGHGYFQGAPVAFIPVGVFGFGFDRVRTLGGPGVRLCYGGS